MINLTVTKKTHIKTSILIFGLIISAVSLTVQDLQRKYTDPVKKADSLYSAKEFKSSALAFSEPYKTKGCKPTSNECYNAACTWALADNRDSAFYYLNYITTRMNYTNSGHMIQTDDPEVVISSIKLALKDFD